MIQDDTRKKIENIVSGAIIEGEADTCTAIRNYLCRRFATSTTVKDDFQGRAVVKKEQTLLIEQYCDTYNLWVAERQKGLYLTRGGEVPHKTVDIIVQAADDTEYILSNPAYSKELRSLIDEYEAGQTIPASVR